MKVRGISTSREDVEQKNICIPNFKVTFHFFLYQTFLHLWFMGTICHKCKEHLEKLRIKKSIGNIEQMKFKFKLIHAVI